MQARRKVAEIRYKKNIDKYYAEDKLFFSAIGQIAYHVTLIEKTICKFLTRLTDGTLNENSTNKNFVNLLIIFELAFLAKNGADAKLKKWFFVVKNFLIEADRFRNVALHVGWGFIIDYPYKASYRSPDDPEMLVIISPILMQKRAIFCQEANNLLYALIALTHPGDYADKTEGNYKVISSHFLKEFKKSLSEATKLLNQKEKKT